MRGGVSLPSVPVPCRHVVVSRLRWPYVDPVCVVVRSAKDPVHGARINELVGVGSGTRVAGFVLGSAVMIFLRDGLTG